MEQHLRINSDGHMWLSRYRFGDCRRYICFSKEQRRIDVEVAKRILIAIEECFSAYDSSFIVPDVGVWKLIVSYESEENQTYHGSLIKQDGGKEDAVSQLIRDALDMPELYVFDGDAIPNRIMRFSADDHRVSN